MPTIMQLVLKIRKVQPNKYKKPALQKCPQKKGVCIRPLILTPRKPNSAKRKVVRLLLSNKKKITAYVQGIGKHYLQKYSVVLVRGGRIKDLPGIKYKTIRGKFDLKQVPNRTKARSKHGIKNFNSS
jgi:small subunit ribosomal protein S12